MPGIIDFKKVMEARRQAQQAEAEKAKAESPAAYVDPEATLSVRSFTAEGIARVTDLLRKMRIEETILQDDVDALVNDIEYSRQLDENIKINPDKIFKTKLELCEYFTKIFTSDFLASHRRDKGLWTWLAMAYFKQFVKTKNNIVEIASDARWVFIPENFRPARRHYIAGPIYLYEDVKNLGPEVVDMLFYSSPREFGGFIDAVTYKQEGTRMPALLKVAARLYYDPSSPKRLKKKVIAQDKPGTVRQLLRVSAQFALTRDFFEGEDTNELWNILPRQFDCFKDDSDH